MMPPSLLLCAKQSFIHVAGAHAHEDRFYRFSEPFES